MLGPLMTFSGFTKKVSKSFHLNPGTVDHLKMEQHPYLRCWLALHYERNFYFGFQPGNREANSRNRFYSHLLA